MRGQSTCRCQKTTLLHQQPQKLFWGVSGRATLRFLSPVVPKWPPKLGVAEMQRQPVAQVTSCERVKCRAELEQHLCSISNCSWTELLPSSWRASIFLLAQFEKDAEHVRHVPFRQLQQSTEHVLDNHVR